MRASFLVAFVILFGPVPELVCLEALKETRSCLVGDDGTCLEEGVSPGDDGCIDQNSLCSFWADRGECDQNPQFMFTKCPKSCGGCGANVQQLIDEMLEKLRQKGVGAEPVLVKTRWGVAQEVSGDNAAKTQQVVEDTTRYMEDIVFVDKAYEKVRRECKNRHEHCAFWVTLGECENNPKYMLLQCAPSCQTCDKIDFDSRCPFDPTAPTIFNPGDVNRMFERILSDPYYAQYEPVVHSRPNPGAEEGTKDGPWVITLENFTTSEECDGLIQLGADRGYEVSKDVGKQLFDGTFEADENDGRTSTNAWCTEECFEHALTQNVLARIENVTGVPDSHSEFLQLLRYEETQFYRRHHDYIAHNRQRSTGVRILTVFLYLNNVEAGGGTNFPRLGLTVQPKKGRAVIWPSVLDEDPNAKDPRTDHQALPVERGVKYGANAWLHQRDFKTPYEQGCV